MYIFENEKSRSVNLKGYNSYFNKETGEFRRWGKTQDENPDFAPMPEILDLEISAGKCMGMCAECYKKNGAVEETHNMSFEEFKNIFHKVARTVVEIRFTDSLIPEFSFISDELEIYKDCYTKQDIINKQYEYFNKNAIDYIKVYNIGLLQQIAFGICNIGSNPDFFKMMRYCREFDVIPNYTCHGLDMNEEYAKLSAELCGAVAVSVYNKEKSYNAVKMLSDAGCDLNQIIYIKEE